MPTETQSFGIIMAPLKTSKNASDKTAVGDEPIITEAQWRAFSIASAILTGVFVAGAFAWIFADGFDGATDLQLAQTLSPFGVAFFAIVTFCTACWRGSINVRQADQAEREGRAKLLQEGAKLLGERENPSHVSAGIATLEILAVGSDARLATQAMNLIADYVQLEMKSSHDHAFQEQAFSALKNGSLHGRIAERDLNFETNEEQESTVEWKNIEGVRKVRFVGGVVESGFMGDFSDNIEYSYDRVRIKFFEEMELRASKFYKCVFQSCDIKKIHRGFRYRLEESEFFHCDFSGCSIYADIDPALIQGKQNFYRNSNPPTMTDGREVDWSLYLASGYPQG